MMGPTPRRAGTNSEPRLASADLRRRIQSLLGFAVKAGRVTPGFTLTRRGLQSGQVGFVLAARDLAPRRLEALARAAVERGVGFVVAWSRVELGSLLDRGATGAVGITDRALARGMAACARTSSGEPPESGAREGARGGSNVTDTN
jgi:ribosomal protein L7Ae-like RNA K-turn-binding protein